MSVLAVISEYNPFHGGHKYHLEEAKKISGANYSLALMSGSFVQRGEPALVDKWSRANMALASGIDLVVELPFVYAGQRAESFASGAIRLLEGLGLVDYLAFGAETDNLAQLEDLAQVLVNQPKPYQAYLQEGLEKNLAYPAARSQALAQYFDDPSINDLLKSSNSILGLEYLKSLQELASPIRPLLVKRSGASYNSLDQDQGFMSATGIRSQILTSPQPNFELVQQHLPGESSLELKRFFKENQAWGQLDSYSDLLIYKLRFENPEDIMDSTKDLVQRLKNQALLANKIEDIIEASISKTYTRTRIKRVLVNILLGLTNEDFKDLDQAGPSYIRLLAANEKGLDLLRKIKDQSNLAIINKFSKHHRLKNPQIERMLAYDKAATDLFYLGLPKKNYNMDYLISPQIKKP